MRCHFATLHTLTTDASLLVQVRERMQHLKEDLFEKVSAVLESPSEAPNGQAALRAALAGRWQAALDKAACFWERHGSGSSSQRADLQAPLQDLHQYIHSTIDAEVSNLMSPLPFWACQLLPFTCWSSSAAERTMPEHFNRPIVCTLS